MPTNPYFNFYPETVTSEQLLIEDLVIEANKIHGMDVYYLPRESRDQIDKLKGEDQLKSFPQAYIIEMYVENIVGMDGLGDIISKFGMEIRDEMTLLVSRRRFNFTIPALVRPREGDIIFIPLMRTFMEITFVEHENQQAMFYTLGRGRGGNVYVYALRLKQFVFSNEVIKTGVDDVDSQIHDNYQLTNLVLANGVGVFDFANNEIVYQGANVAYANAFGTAMAWDATNTTLSIALVNGLFANTANVKGANSGAQWIMSSLDTNTPLDTQFEDAVDNKVIETEADVVLDFSETNPFGDA
jgi:hypothetical protein